MPHPAISFSFFDSRTVGDQGGRILEDDDVAADIADRLARELHEIRPELRGPELPELGRHVDGEVVHRADRHYRAPACAGARLARQNPSWLVEKRCIEVGTEVYLGWLLDRGPFLSECHVPINSSHL